jgi:membrane protein implicated in regulation of membrane protease activity
LYSFPFFSNFEKLLARLKIMEIWIYWVIAALILVIVELFTAGFAVICLSIGCGCAAIAAAYDTSLEWQLLIFAIASIIALAGVRPMLKRFFYKGGEKVPTNASAMLGKHGVVCADINGDDEQGRVMIEGIDWRAITTNDEHLPIGTRIVVTEINSVVLTVKKL